MKHKFSHISNEQETGIENYWAVPGVGKRRWRGLPGALGQVSQCRGQAENQAQGQIHLLAPLVGLLGALNNKHFATT